MRAIPGVRSVGTASSGPLFGGTETEEFVRGGDTLSARWYDVSPDYFRTLGVALRRGRWLTDANGEGAPRVALVNEALARRWWPRTGPHRPARAREERPWCAGGGGGRRAPVVPGRPAEPEIYWPSQVPRWASYVVMRTAGDPTGIMQQVRERLRAIDPDLEAAT